MNPKPQKTAVITGAGSGIGQAIALKFSENEILPLILEIETGLAADTVSQIEKAGGKAGVYACDVSSSTAVESVIASIQEKRSRIDILVNNAGIAHVGNVENTSEEDLDRIYQVNVKGVYNMTKALIGPMVNQGGGVILNLASIASKVGIADRFAYSMSKGAVMTMTQSVARDYVDKKIRCNCVCPARIHTPFVDNFIKKNYPGEEKKMFDQLSAYQPMGRMGTPKEVANLVYFLCSDQAEFITGASYDIDGGVLGLR